MLTEEYLKNHFITAYYIDNDRKMIEIQCRNDDDTKVIPYVIEHDFLPLFSNIIKIC